MAAILKCHLLVTYIMQMRVMTLRMNIHGVRGHLRSTALMGSTIHGHLPPNLCCFSYLWGVRKRIYDESRVKMTEFHNSCDQTLSHMISHH